MPEEKPSEKPAGVRASWGEYTDEQKRTIESHYGIQGVKAFEYHLPEPDDTKSAEERRLGLADGNVLVITARKYAADSLIIKASFSIFPENDERWRELVEQELPPVVGMKNEESTGMLVVKGVSKNILGFLTKETQMVIAADIERKHRPPSLDKVTTIKDCYDAIWSDRLDGVKVTREI